jgi:chromosome partitioning protein
VHDVIVTTDEGVDLLPATIELARAEADLLTRTGREHVVRMALEDLDEYDWVLLDCPPSLGVLTVAALTAARGVLENISETYALDVLQPPIPKSIRFAEAPAAGRSILGTSGNHRGADAYRAVAASLTDRRRVSL